MATTGTPRRPSAPGPTTTGRGTPPAPPRPPRRDGGGRRPARRRRSPVWQAIVTGLQAITLLFLVAIITFMAFLLMQFRTAPASIDLSFDPPGRTLIYSSDGTLMARMFVENRRVVSIDKIPKDLQNATVAFEDKRFYQHLGVDFQGIGRSLFRNIKSGDLKGQGGSTITQQLARNMGVQGLTREKSVSRKVHEWIVANQIEKSYTKQRILEMYMNQVSYGQGAYGVEAAAQTYFGKDVDKLDLAQCALLAGLPNRPTVFNPYKDKAAAQAQRDIVLDNMLGQHYITPQQCAQARSEYIHLAAPKPPRQGSEIYHAPYFVDYVVEQLKKRYGPNALRDGNRQVETTLNWPMQQVAEAAVRNGIADVGGYNVTQGALVALDPKTGEIKAMVGGVDYKASQYNIAAHGLRQPGSSFKAVIYSAAIDSGVVTENTTVYDAPTTFRSGGRLYTPQDDNGWSYDHPNLRTAMAQSINVPAVKVLHLLTPQVAVRYAHIMGVNPETRLAPVLSLALGSSGVTPLEMADVYATIASGGNHPVPTPFTRITDSNGKTVEDIPPAVETHVLKRSTVQQLDDMLRAVVTEGTGKVVGDVPDARGKTGTTQGHRDTWFVGYTPQLVCAVWAGHPTHNKKTGQNGYGEEMSHGAWGMSICAPIWKRFMQGGLPLYQAALAREAARNKPPLKPKPVQIPNADAAITESSQNTEAQPERPSRRRRHGPDTAGSDSAGTPPPPAVTDRADNSDGTTSATVDDNTGLLAPPGSPHSHQETFEAGVAPTVMSPEYGGGTSSQAAAAPDVPAPRHRRRRHDTATLSTSDLPAATAPPATAGTDSGSAAPAAADPPPAPLRRDPPRHRAAPPKPRPEYVTRRVNPEDGKLATQWTPQYVERSYLKGTEPHAYSHMYQPPPGEH